MADIMKANGAVMAWNGFAADYGLIPVSENAGTDLYLTEDKERAEECVTELVAAAEGLVGAALALAEATAEAIKRREAAGRGKPMIDEDGDAFFYLKRLPKFIKMVERVAEEFTL